MSPLKKIYFTAKKRRARRILKIAKGIFETVLKTL